MNVRRAAKFIAVKSSNTQHEQKSVELLLEAEDGVHYALEFDPRVVPVTIASLASRLNELAAIHPDFPSQALTVQGMNLAMSSTGGVGLQLQLDGSMKLALHFPPEQLAPFVAMLDEMKELLVRRVQ